MRELEGAAAVLVADYGRGVAAHPDVRRALGVLPRCPSVWDPHCCGAAPVAVDAVGHAEPPRGGGVDERVVGVGAGGLARRPSPKGGRRRCGAAGRLGMSGRGGHRR